MNNIINNSHIRNTYTNSNINIENKNIQNNINLQKNTEQLYNIDNLNNQEVEKFIKRIQDEIQRAQLISIKIVKGSKVTKEELEFITKKYPDIKQIADESISDYKKLIKDLEICKTNEEIDRITSKEIKEIYDMVRNGYISDVQSKVKILVIEEAIKFNEKVELELNNEEYKDGTKKEILNSYINSYIYTILSMFENNLGIIIAVLLVISAIYLL